MTAQTCGCKPSTVLCIPIRPDRMDYITRSLAVDITNSRAVYRTAPFDQVLRVSGVEYNQRNMKFAQLLVVFSCALLEARGYPYYPVYGNVDTYSYGDSNRGGMALSRYYNPFYNPGNGGASMAAFTYRQPEQPTRTQSSQYYLPDRRRQTPQEANFNVPPQQNEVYYPQQPENPAFIPTEATELIEPTEKAIEVAPTTAKAVVPELVEHEIEEVPEEPAPKPKKAVTKRKQVKRPVDDDDDDDSYSPKMPTGAYFPMFFGWGGRSGGQPNGGPTAIANAFSTGRGGVATSHATAYGIPRPEERV